MGALAFAAPTAGDRFGFHLKDLASFSAASGPARAPGSPPGVAGPAPAPGCGGVAEPPGVSERLFLRKSNMAALLIACRLPC